MGAARKRTSPIERLSEEQLFVDILRYLRTLKSSYFEYNSRQPAEESILILFDGTTDEQLKNRLRQAVRLCLEREDLRNQEWEFALHILNLVEEMRITQAKDILLELLGANEFPHMSVGDMKRLKRKLISILGEFHIPEESMRSIIDDNIDDPALTDECLIAATKFYPPVDSFVAFLPKALRVYEAYPREVRLPSTFRVFLGIIGIPSWQKRASDILLFDRTKTEAMLGLLAKAGLEPQFGPFGIEEVGVVEQFIRWPFERHPIVSAILLYETSAADKEILQTFLVKKIGSRRERGRSLCIARHTKRALVCSPASLVMIKGELDQ